MKNFNEWNEAIVSNGFDWAYEQLDDLLGNDEDQHMVLELAIKNQLELIGYRKSLATYDDKPWKYMG